MTFIGIHLLFSLILFQLALTNSTNYISYGSFESPRALFKNYITGIATGWSGQYFDLLNDIWVGYGQAIDLQRGIGQNGYIEQTVQLPNASSCNLSFYQQAQSNNSSKSAMIRTILGCLLMKLVWSVMEVIDARRMLLILLSFLQLITQIKCWLKICRLQLLYSFQPHLIMPVG